MQKENNNKREKEMESVFNFVVFCILFTIFNIINILVVILVFHLNK
jgi:hypothetical protein